jgi:hypothetical protein
VPRALPLTRPRWAAANWPGGDDRLVATGEPLAVRLYLAEVDARVEDGEHRRVLDAGGVSDLPDALPLGPQREDAPDDRCHLVGDELAVDEGIPRLGAVDPLALAHGLLHAHAHVLGQLLAVELRERTEDVVEHPARRRREVDLLGERVQCHPGLAETVGQQDQVAQVPRQSVEPPREHVGHVAFVDHVQQLLQSGPLEVLAREPGVGDHRHLAQVVQLGVDAQLVSLPGDRETLRRLFLGRHPAVRHRQHPCAPVSPRSPCADRSARAPTPPARSRARPHSSQFQFTAAAGHPFGEGGVADDLVGVQMMPDYTQGVVDALGADEGAQRGEVAGETREQLLDRR